MSNYRILLIEDEESLASMLRLNLEMEGYQVVYAADGLVALEKFRNLLRVSKLIKRHDDGHKSIAEQDEYTFGPNSVNYLHYTIKDKDGISHEISKREIMLLKLLIQKAGEVVSREEILEKVWGYDVFPSTRTIDNYILAFRKYFEPDSRQPLYFHSVRGVGYRFTPPSEKSF